MAAETVSGEDEKLHSPGSAANWRESYYFGFNGEAGQTGMAYISLSPNQGFVVRMILLLMPDAGGTLVHIQRSPLPKLTEVVLTEGDLQFHCLEPLLRWQLRAEAVCLCIPPTEEISSALPAAQAGAGAWQRVPVAFDLCFETRMPAYRYPTGAADFLGNDQEHFEQMGCVTGRLRIGSTGDSLVAPAARDRSWGVRNWLRPEWYSWMHLNFGPDLLIGAVIGRAEGHETSSGFVYQGGLFQPVLRVDLEADRDPHDLHLRSGRARIVTGQAQTLDLDFDPLSFFHIILAREGGEQSHDSVTALACRYGEHLGRGLLEGERREPMPSRAPGVTGLW